ncbi:MAG: hypothetical protein ACREV1_12585 [Gammaproteobacteria bacterium]
MDPDRALVYTWRFGIARHAGLKALGGPEKNYLYRRAVVAQRGVPGTKPFVKIPGRG